MRHLYMAVYLGVQGHLVQRLAAQKSPDSERRQEKAGSERDITGHTANQQPSQYYRRYQAAETADTRDTEAREKEALIIRLKKYSCKSFR